MKSSCSQAAPKLSHSPKPAALLPRAGPGGDTVPPGAEEPRSQEVAAGKLLPPWISAPESDAKGRNSTAVSNAQLTPTTARCQGKGRGEGETATVSLCLGPGRLLNQRRILSAQGRADEARQAETRSCSPLLVPPVPATPKPHIHQHRDCPLAPGKPQPNEEKSQGRWKKPPCSS